MKLDSIVIVDEHNKTLWVRSGTYPLQDAWVALKALKPAGDHPLYILRSFVDDCGNEIMVELATRFARRRADNPEAKAVRMEVWHAKEPRFWLDASVTSLDKAHFECAARVLAEIDDPFEAAYEMTQNLDNPWNPVRAARSTAVGDVIVACWSDGTREARAVDSVGFRPLKHFE